jgi:hypothetical protein
MKRRVIFLLTAVTAALLLFGGPLWAQAAEPQAASGTTGGSAIVDSVPVQPGNYCISCHLPGDGRLEAGAAWMGGIEGQPVNPCPASARIQEELYYTERLLAGIDFARADLLASTDLEKTDARLAAIHQTYSRLLDSPAGSLEAFTAEAQTLRYNAGKIYTQLHQVHENQKIRNILIAASLATVFILLSLAWGYRNTRAIHPDRSGLVSRANLGLSASGGVLIIIILILFSLPLFRVPAAETVTASSEEQASQTVIDTAQRAASAAERAQARAWMLARVGAARAENGEDALEALDEALAGAREAQMNTAALWGGAQAAQEVNAGSHAGLEKANLAASQLDAARSRAWGLRMIAAEWVHVDPERAQEILEEARQVAHSAPGLYRDLDLRAIAVTYAAIDLDRGLEIAAEVKDAGLRSWAYREIGAMAVAPNQSSAMYAAAVEAARLVDDPIQRARLLAETARHSGQAALFQEALAALDGIEGASRAYALADLAARSGELTIADLISNEYPGAKAYAYYRLGRHEQAWLAAGQIVDGYERAKAQAAIAAAWKNADAAGTIAVSTWRDRALQAIAVAARDPGLVNEIQSAYYRVQAYTRLGDLPAAQTAALELKDAAPLVELGLALAAQNPEQALLLLDLMEREADKAPVLSAAAAASGRVDLFERALGMALAARVRGNALSPVQTSLDLALHFMDSQPARADTALNQALEAAQRISIK